MKKSMLVPIVLVAFLLLGCTEKDCQGMQGCWNGLTINIPEIMLSKDYTYLLAIVNSNGIRVDSIACPKAFSTTFHEFKNDSLSKYKPAKISVSIISVLSPNTRDTLFLDREFDLNWETKSCNVSGEMFDCMEGEATIAAIELHSK